jgi:hypothetical protein
MEFAALLHAKQIRRGRWLAKCPSHPDKRPSLAIDEGHGKQAILLNCRSHGCTGDEIIRAMGLTWKDVLGARPTMTREARKRLSDQQALHQLKAIRRLLISNTYVEMPELWSTQHGGWLCKRYVDGMRYVDRHIRTIENRLYPELKAIRERDAKTERFVRRWGWDKLWSLYLERLDSTGSSSSPIASEMRLAL